MMRRIKELKYFTLVMLLFGFVAAGSLSSCRDQKKKESTEQGEHPEGEEHPTEEAADKGEHPAKDGDEHPKKEGGEHPEGEGEHPEGEGEHPEGEEKDSVSG